MLQLTAVAHSLIFFYMLVSLTVAINSYDYTLLSLLISNQFVEIKGCTWRSFQGCVGPDPQRCSRSLRRRTCSRSCVRVRLRDLLRSYGAGATVLTADIVERFQLSLMLCVIAIRNVIEMSGSDIAFLPKSFMRGKSLIDSIFSVSLARSHSWTTT